MEVPKVSLSCLWCLGPLLISSEISQVHGVGGLKYQCLWWNKEPAGVEKQ